MTLVVGQAGQDAGGALPGPVAADGAVALAQAGWAGPVGVLQGLADVLPVSVSEADSAEGAPHAVAVAGPAERLGVQGLLAALVAGGPVLAINLNQKKK